MTLKFKSGFLALAVPPAFMAILGTMAAFPMGVSIQNGKIIGSILGIIIAAAIIYLAIRKEGSTFREYQLFYEKGTIKRFGVGFLLSLAIGGGMLLAHIRYSDLQLTLNTRDLNTFLLMSLLLIPMAFMEELIFRSYVHSRLTSVYNIWIAQIIVASLFAVYHMVGAQGQSLTSAFMGPGIWAFIFGALALKSNGISMPTGFHYGLNLILAIFGSKAWIPGIWTVEFKGTPSAEALQAHELFGVLLHLTLLIIGISATFYLSKQMSKAKTELK